MAEHESSRPQHGGIEQPDVAALSATLSDAGASAEAREYLRQQRIVAEKQARLLDLEIGDLERENRLRHWSLRFGNLSAVMKAGFEIALAFIFLVMAAGIAAAIWTASRDNSLVIEAFSVPPDMAARGLTGQAVASQLEDRLATMQELTDSARPANSYVNNWGDDIKVQIPDTGISIGEFYRFLEGWLGHQTRITGEVFRTADGIAITARASGTSANTASGPEAKFDALLQQTAEAIYDHTQTYRYAIYMIGREPPGRRRNILLRLAREGTTVSERTWALNGVGSLDAAAFADLYSAVAEYRKITVLKPDFALAWSNIGEYESTLGHDEEALKANRRSLPLFASNRGVELTERSADILFPGVQASIAAELGDFGAATAHWQSAAELPDYSESVEQSLEAVVIARADLHDSRGALSELDTLAPTTDPAITGSRSVGRFWAAFMAEDWASALKHESEVERAFSTAGLTNGIDGNAFVVIRARRIWPASAYASAAMSDFAAAHALADRTPSDCYFCVRMRGRIDAAEKNWNGAAFWLAEAVRQAPSLPFAYAEQGAVLLGQGNYDGAIEKFREASLKGPHFADPLEMWGEALMLKNRSDLALEKFEEANKYAPNWSRLHLKWGEALVFAGKRDEAKKQFALASALDLSASEKSELLKNARPT
ncbi:MAG TPA: tetratricopeptide repeat protein [Rhizomicrobium sp.]|nr:tetratricopeptide repeat protein [Rhizomicrobium sp.]